MDLQNHLSLNPVACPPEIGHAYQDRLGVPAVQRKVRSTFPAARLSDLPAALKKSHTREMIPQGMALFDLCSCYARSDRGFLRCRPFGLSAADIIGPDGQVFRQGFCPSIIPLPIPSISRIASISSSDTRIL